MNVRSIQKLEREKKGGRPRKFAEPSQPITITLPNSTLRQLQDFDSDRGRAIVKLARNAANKSPADHPLVEILEMAHNTGLVVIGPAPSLAKIRFIQLVEVAPARYLLALSPGHGFHELEIALNDLLSELGPAYARDRELISQLLAHFRTYRKSDSMSTAQILLLRLQPNQ